MGWGPPATLSHLIRDDLVLRLICPCGHEAEPDVRQLRRQLGMRGGWRERLTDLGKNMRCGKCGGTAFRYEARKR